jgi:hypothetical protein
MTRVINDKLKVKLIIKKIQNQKYQLKKKL